MYSEAISKLLESLAIRPGDGIRVETEGISLEGELMPKTEAGSPDTIIVKLKSGYNAGIAYGPGMRITKLAGGKPSTVFPLSKPKADPKLPNVSVLWTGGTIGSKIDYKTSGVYMTVKPEELLYYVPELSEIANISLNHLFGAASEDLTSMEWARMAEETAKALNSGARGVVITHGTDTMHYTASALSFMLDGLNAPVVLTGSQRSSDRGSSDAFTNLAGSLRMAAYSDIAEVGICMHASSSDDRLAFIRGTKARKMHTSRRDAFRPINDRAIAYVRRDGELSYHGDYRKVSTKGGVVNARTKFETKVAIVKAYPNSDPQIVDYYSSKGYKGLIVEGTGLGHTPVSVTYEGKSWLPHLRDAVAGGMVVGMTSQCLYGRVHANVYKNLRLLSGAGVVYCEDMLPETAYVKLGWLLGNHGAKEAGRMLNKNIAGEIRERINMDEFLV